MAEQKTISKAKLSSKYAQSELDKAEKQFQAFEENVKSLTMDRMNEAPKLEEEHQTKLSQKEIEKSNVIYLKPKRSIEAVDPKTGQAQKFNEKYRKDYEYAKERVDFIAENRELSGEDLTLWTRPFGGMPAEEWVIPTNKIVNGPRHLAEQIKSKCYHRLVMQENRPSNLGVDGGGVGQFYGSMVADTTVQRLDAYPANSKRKSIFMGDTTF